MIKFLNDIRNVEKPISNNRKIINTIFISNIFVDIPKICPLNGMYAKTTIIGTNIILNIVNLFAKFILS